MSSALASFGVLLLVIVSIPLVLWLVKRLSQLPGGTGNTHLKLQATLPVGTREQIAVITAGKRTLVVGITAGSIQLLTELDEPLPVEKTATGSSRFAAILQQHS